MEQQHKHKHLASQEVEGDEVAIGMNDVWIKWMTPKL